MSDHEFLMRMGEARFRLEALYDNLCPWDDFEPNSPFWGEKVLEPGSKLNIIRKTLQSRHEELFKILLLMNPNREKP